MKEAILYPDKKYAFRLEGTMDELDEAVYLFDRCKKRSLKQRASLEGNNCTLSLTRDYQQHHTDRGLSYSKLHYLL